MKLLIVDDQYSVVKGLREGIDWRSLGITEVDSAQNAMKARLCFKHSVPDIMLCDIEMPVENGVDLCRWIRSENYDTRIIFLTCHAEFEYAKEALHLGVADYILQPAPYEKIYEVVGKVAQDLQASIEQRQLLNLGQMYHKQQSAIRSSVLRNYLNGGANIRALDAISDFWDLSCPVRLILVQVMHTPAVADEKWDASLLLTAISSFAEEIFEHPDYLHVTASLQNDTYCIALQSCSLKMLDDPAIMERLQYLINAFEVYMPHEIACYTAPPAAIAALTSHWSNLIEKRDANVACHSGMFTSTMDPTHDPHTISREMPQLSFWKTLLRDGQLATLKALAYQELDQMVHMGTMTSSTLLAFYQCFMQMLFDTDTSGQTMKMFATADALDLYRNGMKSVDAMKQLIAHVVSTYTLANASANHKSHKEIVAYITNHIQKNLESNIRNDDLAKQLFISADHLTKIFKKETGLTIKGYITAQKMQGAQHLLRTTQLPVSYIAAKLGYTNFSHFSSTYKKEMGVTPLEERDMHAAI